MKHLPNFNKNEQKVLLKLAIKSYFSWSLQSPHYLFTMADSPPEYSYRMSLLPRTLAAWWFLTVEYVDDKPSISLTGLIPDAHSDVYTPPRGRAVRVSDLRNIDARRRFGAFGRILVDSERQRRSPPRYDSNHRTIEDLSTSAHTDREERTEAHRVTRRFGRLYVVSYRRKLQLMTVTSFVITV